MRSSLALALQPRYRARELGVTSSIAICARDANDDVWLEASLINLAAI